MRRPAPLVGSLALAGALVATSAVPGSAGPSEEAVVDVVKINFDTGVRGQPMPANILNLGDPDVVATKVVKNGGDIIVANGRVGNGRAADMPAFDPALAGPRAAVKVVDSDQADGDALSPGLQRFTFGADFALDALSSDPVGYDNGNNLIQRGLQGVSDQYKIQVDKASDDLFYPSCWLVEQVGGVGVPADVKSEVPVEFGKWYRVRCTRSGSILKIVVTPYAADGTPETTKTNTKPGIPALDLSFTGTEQVPMSIGSKMASNGTIVNKGDQFNGLIDTAYMTVG